jgi:YidC/Oxa1 family membrane protein insertase
LRSFSKHPPCPGNELNPNVCVANGDFSWLHNFVPNIAAHVNAHWSGYVLLVVYVGSQLASTFLMSSTMDKTQRTMFLILPVGFVFFLLNFPTGLLIYWVTTNLWTVGQGIVTRRLVPKKPPPPPKRSSRTPPKSQVEADGAQAEEEAAGAQPPAIPAAPKRVRRKKKKKARR